MRNKLFSLIAVVAVAAVASYNVYNSKSEVKLSDLAMANVEALAGGEWPDQNCYWADNYYISCVPWGSHVACVCYR